jgi:nuclear transport factor 2 (NTF2) superfamily protein
MMQSKAIVRALVVACAALFLAPAGASQAGQAQGLTIEKLQTWLGGYGTAWETRSAKKAGKLFSADATYRETPYDAPFAGRKAIQDYWSGVTKDQKDIKFTSEALSASGNTGIAHWHAEFVQLSNGAKVTLDGIFVMEFAEDGLCKTFQEWWHVKTEEAKANAGN